MTAMKTLMIILMSCLALFAFLSWRMDKERLLYAERLAAMTDELRRLREDNIRLRDEMSTCYIHIISFFRPTVIGPIREVQLDLLRCFTLF